MEENPELKAGHPPAAKVGNMRVAAPRHRNSNSDSASASNQEKISNEELKKQEDEYGTDVAESKQGQVVAGSVVNEAKAFTPDAVRAYHEKPVPKVEKPHAGPAHNIQQPRK